MKPKIGIIHYSYPPIIGGVEIMVKQQATLFAKHGYEITVFAGEGVSDRADIKLVEIPEIKSLRNLNNVLYEEILNQKELSQEFFDLSNLIYEKLCLNLKDIDVLIIHNMLTLKFNMAFNYAFKKYVEENPDKKYIAWTHDVSLDLERKRFTFVNNQVEELIYKPFPNVFYVGISHFLKKTLEDMIGFPKDSVHVIHNSIPIQDFLSLNTTTNKLIEKYRLLDSYPLIFLPGKMMPHKNIDVVLKVLSELKKTYEFPKLVISARAFHHNKNKEYIEKIDSIIHELSLESNIMVIQDEIGNDEIDDFDVIKDFYKICDVILFLSSYENFGLPILEAGVTKNIIICSDLEVFHEVSSENVYFVNISEPSSEIGKFVADVLSGEKSAKLFREVKEKYNLNTVFKKQILPLIGS